MSGDKLQYADFTTAGYTKAVNLWGGPLPEGMILVGVIVNDGEEGALFAKCKTSPKIESKYFMGREQKLEPIFLIL